MVYKRPPIGNSMSGEPMDPFTEQSTVRQLQQFSCNRYDQRRCIWKWTRRVIAIDIQDGYDKFNDNVKILSTALKRPKHYYKQDVFTSNNESQAQAEGNGLFEKRFCKLNQTLQK
jgi:hypothetical protein